MTSKRSDEKTFREQVQGSFEISAEQMLNELARQYHEDCERFDRGVCSGRRDGIALPVNGNELGLIGRNAREVRAQLLEEVFRNGATADQFDKAIRRNA